MTDQQGDITATAIVTIRVLDANDETPTFNRRYYNASVQEHMPLRIPVNFLPLGTEMIVRDYDQVGEVIMPCTLLWTVHHTPFAELSAHRIACNIPWLNH